VKVKKEVQKMASVSENEGECRGKRDIKIIWLLEKW